MMEILFSLKFNIASCKLKTIGELKTVHVKEISIVILKLFHVAQVNGAVKSSLKTLNSSSKFITQKENMNLSNMIMNIWMLITSNYLLITVILMLMDVSLKTKSSNVKSCVKMLGELNIVMKIVNSISIVLIHIQKIPIVKDLGVVPKLNYIPNKSSELSTPTEMLISILVMKSMLVTYNFSLTNVIPTMIIKLINTKFSTVYKKLKMNGDKKIVPLIVNLIVQILSLQKNALVNGLVLILKVSLMKLSLTMIPILMLKLIFKMIFHKITTSY